MRGETERKLADSRGSITVRDWRFNRAKRSGRNWLADPVSQAWHTALSATFPRGEAFFIESIKPFRAGTPPQLEAQIRDFIRQEVSHSREHLAFNKAAADAGYDLSRIDAHVIHMLDIAKGRPPVVNLAATMALEHFTAIMAHLLLVTPGLMDHAEADLAAMWRWHAIEEIEHKAVAYDTWLHATRAWPRRKRWMVKALTMLTITGNFIPQRIRDTLDLLRQDGLSGWRITLRLFWYLLGYPGVLRRLIPAWIAYFLPGFHPWNHDDHALIAKTEPSAQPATA
ncbi:MAG: hypothetical protein RLZZ136_634 [Pseudomonadota bacterium]